MKIGDIMNEQISTVQQPIVSIDDILTKGEYFPKDVSQKKQKYADFFRHESCSYSADTSAILEYVGAVDRTKESGYIVTLPELIASLAKAEKQHDVWRRPTNLHTEKFCDYDVHGLFYQANTPVLMFIHGGGILDPDVIIESLCEKRGNESFELPASYSPLRNKSLLESLDIPIYTFEQIQKGESSLPHRYAVITPISEFDASEKSLFGKKSFMTNPAVIASVGDMNHLETFYENAGALDLSKSFSKYMGYSSANFDEPKDTFHAKMIYFEPDDNTQRPIKFRDPETSNFLIVRP